MAAEPPSKRRKPAVLVGLEDGSTTLENYPKVTVRQLDAVRGTYVVTDPMNDHFDYSIGNSLWSASLELIDYLVRSGDEGGLVQRAVEVGAGCGAAGISLWGRGSCNVVITDLHEMLPIMRINCSYNLEKAQAAASRGSLSAMALDWTDPSSATAVYDAHGPFDVVVGAEVSYDDDLHAALVDTLAILCGMSRTSEGAVAEAPAAVPGRSGTTQARVLLAIPQRDNDWEVLDLCERRGFSVTQVMLSPPDHEHSSPVGIFELVPSSRAPVAVSSCSPAFATAAAGSKHREDSTLHTE